LYRLIAGRLRTIGIVEPTSAQVDIGEVQLAVYSVLSWLVQAYDLDAYTVHKDHWFATEAGESVYDLPPDFGRLLSPHEEGDSGVFLDNGTWRDELPYQRVRESADDRQERPGAPTTFSIIHPHKMWLSPLPDDNGGANYTVGGAYVVQIEPAHLTGAVPHPITSMLEQSSLAQIASDKGSPVSQSLEARAANARTQFINAQARQRQRFQQPASWRRSRSIWRGR
jgi:hypothetical protein